MEPEYIVLCGGLKPKGVSAPAVVLNLWGGKVDENVQLRIEDIHRTLYQNIPSEYQDLVEIAAYVYCADQALPRTGQDTDNFGAKWRRRIHLHVPVRRPEFWARSEVRDPLIRLLNFLSDDFYEFSFVKAMNAPEFQEYLNLGREILPRPRVDQVAMFSGGLDSLAGAIDEVKIQRHTTAFVTHLSTQKNAKLLSSLRTKLNEIACGNPPLYITVRVNKVKELGREHTQRTRSFLFATLGCTIARMLGLKSLRFYENGVVSMNLPVCAQVVGGRSTRTTHPRVLGEMKTFFSAIAGEPFIVENPFFWETKGEVIKRIVNAGCGQTIAQSVSCAHTWERTLEHTHCGSCSQCIDRRFGIIAAGAENHDPSTHYKSDVFTQSRPIDEDRILVASYIERARKIKALKTSVDFLAMYPVAARAFKYLGGSATSVAQRILDLHLRHAIEVEMVLKTMLARYAGEILDHKLPGDCLLRVAIDQSSVPAPPAALLQIPANFLWQRGNVWEMRFAGGKSFLIYKHQRGCAYLQRMLKKPGREFDVSELVSDVTIAACDDILDGRISAEDIKDGYAKSVGLPKTDGGAAIDDKALRAYREHLSTLRDELADAKEFEDAVRQQKIESEMASMAEHLTAGTSKDGRSRKLNDPRKRQRDAFRNSVSRTLEEIGAHDEQLHAHLKASLRIGVKSSYTPKSPLSWVVVPLAGVIAGQ